MRNLALTLSMAAVAVTGACKKSDAHQDSALNNDLALAAQAQSYSPQQFVSPSEQGLNGAAPAHYATAARGAAPVARTTAPRSTRRHSSSGGYSRSSGSSDGGYYPSAPSAPAEPERHTVRDAGIGAAAGAVIGATTSRDKVKGGIIGAAAGGILGGIIGHTVDVKRP